MRERKLEKDLEKKEKKISRGERRGLTGRCDQVPWQAPSHSAQTFKKTYTPLSDLRRSPPPLFVPSRAQEFPTLPPKPLKVLPKPEEDKKFFEQWSF